MPRPPDPRATAPTGLIPTQPLAWGQRVSPAFRTELYAVCARLGWTEDHASWLMACIHFETGGTFSPSVRNPRSTATGLIQFMKATAQALGTSTELLGRMSAVEQLVYVEKYFQPYARQIASLEDLYLAILWPAAIGKPSHWVLWPQGVPAYAVNRGLDINRDRRITKGEAAAKPRALLAQGLLADNAWRPPEERMKDEG